MNQQLILSVNDLGKAIRKRRKEAGITQGQLAAFLGYGVRFISELERGKKTVELGKVLTILANLGLELRINEK